MDHDAKRKRDDCMAEALSEFGMKMFQSGLKQQSDGFLRLNEVHQHQVQKLMDENIVLHKRNAELTTENAYLRRKVEEFKVLKTLMSMRSDSGAEDDEAQQQSAQEGEESATDRPTFASIVAPDRSLTDFRKSTWMFQYLAERPIVPGDLSPAFKVFDTVRISEDRPLYVAVAQMHTRMAYRRMAEELLKLSGGVIKEVCGLEGFWSQNADSVFCRARFPWNGSGTGAWTHGSTSPP